MRKSRLVAVTVAGLLLSSLTAVVATPAHAVPPTDPSAAAERDLKARSSGKVDVRRDERGVAHFVGTEPGKPVRRPSEVAAGASAAEQAKGYLQRYGALWSLDAKGAKGSAAQVARTHKAGKGSVVRFQQTVGGLPVLGGELAVALDGAGNLQSVSGETTPLQLPATATRISAAQAQQKAVDLAARLHDVPAAELRASQPQAYAYDAALLGPAARTALAPVWRVEVTGPAAVRHLVLVDRTRGNIALHFNQVAKADRVVCDNNNVPAPDTACTAATAVRTEGEPAMGPAEVDRAYDYVGHTSDFYWNELGVDLTALIGSEAPGETAKLRATVDYCLPAADDPDCLPNAFWNGIGVYLTDGMEAADDVVAHELAHGVTEHTGGLAYWYQSGAINESMSDVFGELVDLTNADSETEDAWKLGEGSPIGVIRDMADPTAPPPGNPRQPDQMDSGYYAASPWTEEDFDNGGVHTNSGVGNKAAWLIARPNTDGPTTFNGQTITGIGYSKAAEVYLRALMLLTSGSDYADLYNVLPQACAELVDEGGVDGIHTGDCEAVKDAVEATEMNKPPVRGKAPEAPVCDTGTKANIHTETFEGSLANWAFTQAPQYPMWEHIDYYARSGDRSLYGYEPITDFGEPSRNYARLKKALTIPSGVKTYLRFDHQYLLNYNPDASPDRYYAGGALLYSTDGGSTFKSASALTWSNGPTKTIAGSSASAYKGFGGDSHGYQSSRVDVSSLAGKSVIFRWRITSDSSGALDGWTLDNVNLYACGGAKPSNPASLTETGGVNRASLKWTAPVWPGDGGLTKYAVIVKKGSTVVKTINVAPDATSTEVTGLSNGVTYTFYVRAYSAGGYGPYLSKGLIGTKLSSALSATTINPGQSTTFYGTLYRPDTGKGIRTTVYLQGRPKGSTAAFTDVTSMTTTSAGKYSFVRKPSSSWEYRAVYKSGYSTYMGTASTARTVTVR